MNCPLNGKPCTKYKGFHVTEKKGDEVKDYSVCEDCLYTQFSKLEVKKPSACSNCGTTIESIMQGGKIGCEKCYAEFDESLSYMISSIQNGTKDIKHTGGVPEDWLIKNAEETSPIKFATELAYKLKFASKNEEYHKASFIKQKLEELTPLLVRLQQTNEERAPEIKKALALFIYQFRKEEKLL